jgi:hypothetical protein
MNKWHGNLDNKVWTCHGLCCIIEFKKWIVKKKQTLAFYTLHTLVYDKKGSFCWRLGLRWSLVSYQLQVDKQCSVAVY